MEVNCEFCSNRRHTNGLVAWSVLRDQRTRIWIFNIIFRLHQRLSTLTNGFCVTKACPFYIDSATSKRLSPQLLALVHHTVPFTNKILPNWTWNIVDCCAWLWAPLQTLIGHHLGTRFYMGGTTNHRCCRTTLDWNFGLSHASRQYGSSLLMLQPCRRNVGLAGCCIGTSEDDGHADDLPTLGEQRWKNIVFGKALTTGLWRLLSMVIGCGSKRILCFSRCTLVDRVKSCISFACALKGLPSGRQALTWLDLTWLDLIWLDLEPPSVTLLLSQFRPVIF